MKGLFFITSNKGKAVESKELFSKSGIDVVQKNLGYPEIKANTLDEVAFFGAEFVKNKIDQPFFLEDAGLFIDALNGFPGVYSAYVFHSIGCKGILKLMKDVENRNATFRSVIAYCETGKEPVIIIGECKGAISEKEIGKNGFGYDPIFIPKGQKRTFAQMETDEKNKFSHRGKSLHKLLDFFKRR